MSKPKKVAFVANTSWYIYNLRIGVIRALQKTGIQITVVAPTDSYTSKLLANDCHFIPLKIDNNGSNPLKDFELFQQLYQIFKNNNFNFVFTYTIKPNIYGAIAAGLQGTKNITILSGKGYSFLKSGWLNYTVKRLYQLSSKFSYQTWFVNKDDLQLFIKSRLVNADKCLLLPGEGVNTNHFKPRNSYKNPNKPITFLFSGRLIWSKGVAYYVNAAKYIQKKYPNTKFKLLGYFGVQNPDAISEKQIESWHESGVVEYLGFTHDVRPFLAETDCFVLPSFYGEGTPRSLLEATSMEIPIVTTDNVGCRFIVKHGVNGFLCTPKNEQDLIDKIEDFLALSEDERLEMGRLGRMMAKEHFHEKLVIQHYEALILGEKTALNKGEKLKQIIQPVAPYLAKEREKNNR